MFTPEGKFGWYELMTSDAEASARFYAKVVGWTTQQMSAGDGPPYTILLAEDVGNAGILSMQGHHGWIGYIAVHDVDAHIDHIVAAGGKLWKPATDVPGMLRFAVLSDPQGAAFVAFTPNPAMPSPARPKSPAPGTIGWSELYTTDLEAGFAFYQKLFGWTTVADMDMGEHGIYRIFDQGEHQRMGDGGMMRKGPHIPAPHWNFYFNVDSIRAAIDRLQAAGGKVVNGPMQVPGGSWTIQASDPEGSFFSLTSPNA